MADTAPVTYQDVLDHLSKVASENGDSFKLKVVRRPSAASTATQHVATFADATWAHIANAESWLGPFAGGGLYVIQIFDGRNDRKHHGTITPSEVPGAPHPPDARVTKQPGWIGPTLIEATPGSGAGAIAYGPQQFEAPGPQYSGTGPRTQTEAGLGSLFEDVRRREADLNERERKNELAAERRANEERARALEREIAALKELATRPPAAPDLGALLSGLVSALAPIATAILAAGAESRRAQLELEKARQEREAREAETARGRPLIDPQILEMMDRQAKRAEEQTTQFASFLKMQAESSKLSLESQAVAQRSMFQTIADMAQLQLRNQSGSEEGIDWGKVVAGALAGLAQLRGASPGVGAATAPVGAGAAPMGGPVPGPNPTAPAQLPDVPAAPELDEIEDRIRDQGSPKEIVEDLKKALEIPGVQAEIEAEGGLRNVISARLSDFFSDPANATYGKALTDEMGRAGVSV